MSTSDDRTNGNAEHGLTQKKLTVLTVVYDHDTCQVSVGAKDLPVALAQMMLHEAQIQLEFTRRQAAAFALQEQLQNVAATQALVAKIAKGR